MPNDEETGVGRIDPELAARALLVVIEEMSERFWCSGWHMSIERALWSAVQSYINGRLVTGWTAHADIALLHGLAQAAGGWWSWNATDGIDTDSRPVFLPMADWIEEVDDAE